MPAASSAARAGKASRAGLRGARRRLSVVSDNKLVEGVATLGDVDDEETLKGATEHVVRAYAGVSKKGYAPYNPRKRNQDSILMEEHAPTGTLFFGVLDGHGEMGDLVSHYFTDRLPARLFASAKFTPDPAGAMCDELAKLERALLSGTPRRPAAPRAAPAAPAASAARAQRKARLLRARRRTARVRPPARPPPGAVRPARTRPATAHRDSQSRRPRSLRPAPRAAAASAVATTAPNG